MWCKAILSGLVCAALGSGVVAQDFPFASFDIASEPVLEDPIDLSIGPSGLLYVADRLAGEIKVLDPDTLELLGAFGDGALFGVRDISFGPDGRAYIAVAGLSRVDVYDVDGVSGEYVQSILDVPRTEGALAHANGRLYVAASGVGALLMIDEGEPVSIVRNLFGLHDIAMAPDGTIWVADVRGRRVVQFDEALNVLQVLGGPEFGFVGPRYLDVDEFGRLIVADMNAQRVMMIDPGLPVGSRLVGVIGDGVPGLGPGRLSSPSGVAVWGSSYFFSDTDNGRIVKYTVVVN